MADGLGGVGGAPQCAGYSSASAAGLALSGRATSVLGNTCACTHHTQALEGEEPAMVPEPVERDEELDSPSMEEVAAEAAAQQAGAAVRTGEAGIEDIAAFEDFVDPATITETRRGAGTGSRGGRGRGSDSREKAADQGAQGTRRGRGRERGRGRGQKRVWEELNELDSETLHPQMKKWKTGSEYCVLDKQGVNADAKP